MQDSDDDGLDAYGGPPSVGASSNSSRPTSAIGGPISSMHHAALPPRSPPRLRDHMNAADQGIIDNIPEADDQVPSIVDQTTLLHNDEEGFALAPVDTTTVKGLFTEHLKN